MKASKIPGRIANKVFIPNNHRNYENAMTAYNDSEVVLTISKPSKSRTIPQNDYLWAVPYKMIADETGSDTESVHHAMRDMFLKEEGGTIAKVSSTTKLTTIQFNEYVDNIIRWAAEFLGLFIPLPNENEMWKTLEQR